MPWPWTHSSLMLSTFERFLFGNTEIHETPAGVHMTTSAAGEWAPIVRSSDVPAAGLLPVSGKTGAVYSVSDRSRSPLALGVAPVQATAWLQCSLRLAPMTGPVRRRPGVRPFLPLCGWLCS